MKRTLFVGSVMFSTVVLPLVLQAASTVNPPFRGRDPHKGDDARMPALVCGFGQQACLGEGSATCYAPASGQTCHSVYKPPVPPLVVPLEVLPTYGYYCDDPPGYYPYVPQCPGGWRPVVLTPP